MSYKALFMLLSTVLRICFQLLYRDHILILLVHLHIKSLICGIYKVFLKQNTNNLRLNIYLREIGVMRLILIT